jgi:hypothetical protein
MSENLDGKKESRREVHGERSAITTMKATSTAPKLNGGVSAGWRSDDGFQVYVFIGTTFRLFALD